MCGLIGIYHKNNEAVQDIFDGLIQVQHRGQDAGGIATLNQEKITLYKELGLVSEIFKKIDYNKLNGNIGIGHVRYPTAGCDNVNEAQPFHTANPINISLAHNGTITNSDEIKSKLIKEKFCQFNTTSDSEVLLNLLSYELFNINNDEFSNDDIFNAILKVFNQCHGGYAVVMLISGIGLVAFRDPNGVRPLSMGKNTNGSYFFASESSAITSLGFEYLKDINPGEAVIIDMEGKAIEKRLVDNAKHTPCIFEYVYFSRPDSTIDSISVHKARLRMGDYLGEKIATEFSHLDIDVVIPVPDTSRTAAMQVAHRLGKKYREGFMKNRYIGRTFIMPGQSNRKKSVTQKLNPIEIEFKDKNVLLVDDSIVRGNTSKKIIEMVRKNGAKKVYFASASPPIRYQNIYGIDMPATKELIANNKTIDQIKNHIGADELIYQDLKDLILSAKRGNPNISEFEDSVFTGNYKIGNITKEYLNRLEATRTDSNRVSP
tara:strand:- start:3914 stop:5377 length:1464 start_codon:yes stop_codon:yes gene_type:complete